MPHNFAVVIFLNKAIEDIVDTRDESFRWGFAVTVYHVIIDLACALVTAEWYLFDGFVEFGMDAVEEQLEELNEVLLLERWQDEF